MANLSLTLPISCQICLGKVKDPVICANNHAFCTVCLEMWLQGNSCCPTCRVGITKENPYRKVLGSSENNEEMNLKNRTQLRKTRLELLGREYETEILNLSNEVCILNQENKRIKEELEKRPLVNVNNPVPNNIEALSTLTKKLQEISSTYDDVRRDMGQLQEEKDRLQKQNVELNMEVSRLREEAKFTKSPKRYEKFTILGLKAKVDQYEKENEQLRKALSNRDKYMEQLQNELKLAKAGDKEICEQGSQVNFCDENGEYETNEDIEESFPSSMIYKYGEASCSQSSCNENVSEVNKMSSLEFQMSPSTSSCSPRSVFLNQSISEPYPRSQSDVLTSSTAEGTHKNNLFPATKKLLELKKMHETRTLSSSSPPVHTSVQRSPGLAWSPGVQLQLVSLNDTSTTSVESSAVHDGGNIRQISEETSFTNQTIAREVDDTILLCTESAVDNNECSNNDLKSSNSCVHESPKRSSNEAGFFNKKIKIENP